MPPAGASATPRLAALLEGSPDMIVIVDRALGIVAASRSVRARFGGDAARGSPATGLVATDGAAALAAAVRRVAAGALAEAIDLPLAGEPGHRVSLAIEPHPDGVALFGRAACHQRRPRLAGRDLRGVARRGDRADRPLRLSRRPAHRARR